MARKHWSKFNDKEEEIKSLQNNVYLNTTFSPVPSKILTPRPVRLINLSRRRRITISVIMYAIVLLYVTPYCEAEYLCGSRLVDALRFICGSRGISGAGRGAYTHTRRGHHMRRRPAAMDITVLCCEQGCSLKQMEKFCSRSERRHRPRYGSRYRQQRQRGSNSRYPRPPRPPHLIEPTTTTTQAITRSSPPIVTTPSRLNSTTTTKSDFISQLRQRYRAILDRERSQSNTTTVDERKSIFHDIIKHASELFREYSNDPGGSGDKYEYEDHDGTLTASFHVPGSGDNH